MRLTKVHHEQEIERSLALRINEEIEISGKPINDLAEALGVTQSSVYAWMAGECSPSPGMLSLLASELGIPVSRFFEPFEVIF